MNVSDTTTDVTQLPPTKKIKLAPTSSHATTSSSTSSSATGATNTSGSSMSIMPSFEESSVYFSGVPPRFLQCEAGRDPPPCIIGIDEAGRGCVLGAMLYGAAFWLESEDATMSAKGYDDSKGLTPEVREKLFNAIKNDEKDNMGYTTVSIPATAISCKMMRQHPYSLNKISWDCCVRMVRRIISEGVNVVRVYVDTVGDPEIYERWLTRQFQGGVAFVVRKKADSLYKVVSAASICAKQTRDHELESHAPTKEDDIWLKEGQSLIGASVGSGYPSDPKTKKFLVDVHDPIFGFSAWVRHSWAPCKTINKDVGVEYDFGEDEEDGVEIGQATLGSFFQKKGAAPADKRNAFYTTRGIKRATMEDF
jgi:ribonuclease H2 subunit A